MSTDCTDACVNQGIVTLGELVSATITGAFRDPQQKNPSKTASDINQLLTNALVTFQCNLPKDVIKTIEDQLTLLRNLTTTTLEEENVAYLTIIGGTFLLLTIFIYVTILMADRTATIKFFILSILVIIIAFAGLFFWLRSIFTSTSDQTVKIVTKITNILNQTIEAGQNAFCCLGSCRICPPCPITT